MTARAGRHGWLVLVPALGALALLVLGVAVRPPAAAAAQAPVGLGTATSFAVLAELANGQSTLLLQALASLGV